MPNGETLSDILQIDPETIAGGEVPFMPPTREEVELFRKMALADIGELLPTPGPGAGLGFTGEMLHGLLSAYISGGVPGAQEYSRGAFEGLIDLPGHLLERLTSVLRPTQWKEHPIRTPADAAMLAAMLYGGRGAIGRLGPRISQATRRGVTTGARAIAPALKRAGFAEPLKGRAYGKVSEVGAFGPEEIEAARRMATSKRAEVRAGLRETKAPAEIEAAREAARAAQEVVGRTELTLEQINELRKLPRALKAVPESSRPELIKFWSKKFKIGIDDFKKILREVIKSERGAVEFRGKVKPWEMTREEWFKKTKLYPPEIYDETVWEAYMRGYAIPDEVLAQFKGKWSPRVPRPGKTPIGNEPLWMKEGENIGTLSTKYAIGGEHVKSIPVGYLDMEEVLADNWVRHQGAGVFEVRKLNPSTLSTISKAVKSNPPKYGVVIEFEGGDISLPIWEVESKGLIRAVRDTAPAHVIEKTSGEGIKWGAGTLGPDIASKPKLPERAAKREAAINAKLKALEEGATLEEIAKMETGIETLPPEKVFGKPKPTTKKGTMYGQEVEIEVIPEKVKAPKGPRKTRTTQEIIDLIEEREAPSGTMLRKAPKLNTEEGALYITDIVDSVKKAVGKLFGTKKSPEKIIEKLTTTPARKALMGAARPEIQKIIKAAEAHPEIEGVYIGGSYTTTKPFPGDVDLIVTLTKDASEARGIMSNLPDVITRHHPMVKSMASPRMLDKYGDIPVHTMVVRDLNEPLARRMLRIAKEKYGEDYQLVKLTGSDPTPFKNVVNQLQGERFKIRFKFKPRSYAWKEEAFMGPAKDRLAEHIVESEGKGKYRIRHVYPWESDKSIQQRIIRRSESLEDLLRGTMEADVYVDDIFVSGKPNKGVAIKRLLEGNLQK